MSDQETGDRGQGLYAKYDVQKNGTPVEECFVLEPESDPAALEALRTYADETENRTLRSEIRGWIMSIEEQKQDAETDPCGDTGPNK